MEEVRSIRTRIAIHRRHDLAAPDIVWWELWVRQARWLTDRAPAAARNANIDVHDDRLVFPDTTVLFIHATVATVADFAGRVPGAITEIRRATGTIEPFLDRGETGLGQHDWVAELAQRITAPAQDASVVCTLDTGIASGHPLIAPALAAPGPTMRPGALTTINRMAAMARRLPVWSSLATLKRL